MSGEYDVRPAIQDIAAIVAAGLKPGVLNEVYENIPDLQSVTAPVMFFDYRGTSLNAGQTYTGYDRVFKINLVCMVGLAMALTQTDIALKALVGQVYDLFATRPNSNLGGKCAEFRIQGDDVAPIVTLGRQVYVGLTFRGEVENYIVTGGEC